MDTVRLTVSSIHKEHRLVNEQYPIADGLGQPMNPAHREATLSTNRKGLHTARLGPLEKSVYHWDINKNRIAFHFILGMPNTIKIIGYRATVQNVC